MKNDNRYVDFKYDNYVKELLSNTTLTEKDIKLLDDIKNKAANKIYSTIIEDLYKLSEIHKLTTTQLATIYDIGVRSIQLWLKELGLNRTIKKAKKIKKKQDDLGGLDFFKECYESSITYKDFKYDDEIQKLLLEITLTQEDNEIIESAIKKFNNKKYVYIIEDLYKLVVIMKTTNEKLSLIYDVKVQTIYTWLGELNFHRTGIKESKRLNPPKKDDYIDFKYENRELNVLKATTFTPEQQEVLKEIYKVWGKSKYKPIIEDLYKFWLNNYTPAEIGAVYGKNNRTFQVFFKKAGLSRDRFEAQAIAKEKRNYKEIMLKGRKTMLKNKTNILGSQQEQYLRNLLNCRLPLEFPNLEIIVGLNNKSILDDGKEIDVPVIIIANDKIIKLAIEYDGAFWHKDSNRDEEKKEYINEKGYVVFNIKCKEQATEKQIKEYIDEFCEEVIIKYINNKLKEVC